MPPESFPRFPWPDRSPQVSEKQSLQPPFLAKCDPMQVTRTEAHNNDDISRWDFKLVARFFDWIGYAAPCVHMSVCMPGMRACIFCRLPHAAARARASPWISGAVLHKATPHSLWMQFGVAAAEQQLLGPDYLSAFSQQYAGRAPMQS